MQIENFVQHYTSPTFSETIVNSVVQLTQSIEKKTFYRKVEKAAKVQNDENDVIFPTGHL